jgi:hypothetical protein
MNRSRRAYVSKIQDPTVTGSGRVDVYRSARSGFTATPSSISFGRVDLIDGFDPVRISLDAIGDRDVEMTVGSTNKVHSPVGVEVGFSDDGVSFQEEIDLVADPHAAVWMKATPSDEEVPAHVQVDRWYERQIQAWGRIWAQGRTRASVLWQATLLPSSDMTAPAELSGSEDEATLDLEVAPAPGRAAAEIYPIAVEDPSGDGVAGADILFAGARSFAGPATSLPPGADQRGNKWLRFVGGDEDIEEAIEFVAVLDKAYETSRALTASVLVESTDGERTITLRKPLYEAHWCRVTFGECSGAYRGGYPALHSTGLSVVVDALGLADRDVIAQMRVCGDAFSGDVLMPECDTVDLPPLDVSGVVVGDQGCGGWWWETDCAAPLEVARSELLVVFPNQLEPAAQLVGP